MSRTISLYFSEAIEPADFTRAAMDLGGEILVAESLDFVFSERTAHVWIYDASGGLDDPRAQPDPYNFPLPFGNPSNANIDMHLSSAPESASLALRIAHGLLSRWPGVASFPFQTVLVRDEAADALAQTVAEGVGWFEVQVLLPQPPSLGELIDEFGGIFFHEDNTDLSADAIAVLAKAERACLTQDVAVGVIEANLGYLWILVRKFDPIDVYRWDLLAPTVNRHVRPHPPSFVVRVLIDGSRNDTESMEVANVLALSFARRVSRLYDGVLYGTFFVALEVEQVKLVIDSGQWPLVT